MGLFSRTELPDLVASSKLSCVSIYLPALADCERISRSGNYWEEDDKENYRQENHRKGGTAQTQLQQVIYSVRQQLLQFHRSETALSIAADLLEAMQSIPSFMPHQDMPGLGCESLAIFYTPQFFRWYWLPGQVAEAVRVEQGFDLAPLLPFLVEGELFYVLGFGQSQVRLLQGSRQGIRQLHWQELPEPLADAMTLNSLEPSLRYPIASAAHRTPIEDDLIAQEASLKQQMYQSCCQLAEQLDRFLGRQNAVLLAGIPQVLSTYRKFNRIPTMLNSDLIGNLDTMKLDDLHQQAWNSVQELVSREREQALRQYQQAVEQGSASNHLGEIITRAVDRKVETLFILSAYQKWGRFNPYTWEVDVHWQAEPGDIDLTQLAIEQTLLYGGSVYIMRPETSAAKTPASEQSNQNQVAFEPIAAILRL